MKFANTPYKGDLLCGLMFYHMCTDVCKDLFLSGLWCVPDVPIFLFFPLLTCDVLNSGNNYFIFAMYWY